MYCANACRSRRSLLLLVSRLVSVLLARLLAGPRRACVCEGGGQVAFLFPFHATILKPDFDLALGEAQHVRNFDAPASRQVAVEMEFLFEFKSLVSGVDLATSSSV